SVAVGEPPAERRTPSVPHYLWIAAAVIAAFTAGAFLFRYDRPPSSSVRSLAVLPLENLSGDPDQEFFCDGLTDALITDLAGIDALDVRSRTSVLPYTQRSTPVPAIASELNVTHVAEGTVLREGDRVRITIQLIDARNDRHIWAESYEEDLENVIAVQHRVARSIAKAIGARLTGQEAQRLERSSRVNREAYVACLRGQYFARQWTGKSIAEANRYF
ncbi:MAG: guanylyl cyclase, partial [bacterium]|nr:guanylyl cyclase [bacterium]